MGYKKHFRVHHGEHEFARGNYTARNMNSDFITEREEGLYDGILTLLREIHSIDQFYPNSFADYFILGLITLEWVFFQ